MSFFGWQATTDTRACSGASTAGSLPIGPSLLANGQMMTVSAPDVARPLPPALQDIERFLLALAALDGRRLAGRPGEGAVGMQRHRVDPAPLRIGRQQRHLTLGVERDDLAVVAAHDEALAGGGRGEDAAAVDSDAADLARGIDQRDVLL